MAVKATSHITVYQERDISAVWRFYQIAASTSTPSAPTEAQGKAFINSGTAITNWSTVEPSYDGTSTNSLYVCDLTSFTDGNVSWSPVSKSSSYEAAKEAYNKAETVETEQSQALSDAIENLNADIGSVISYADEIRTDLEDAYLAEDTIDETVIGDITIPAATALRISSSGGHSVVLHPEGLVFYDSAEVVAYLSNDKLYINNAEILSEHRVGNFVWDTSPAGNFRLRYSPTS